jgi:hypothetical protein
LTTKGFLGGTVIGYILSGSYVESQFGDSGGTLSGALLPGFTTDAIFQISDGSNISVVLLSDAVADLADCTGFKVDTTVCPLSTAASYDGTANETSIIFDGSSITMTASTTYTVQLV